MSKPLTKAMVLAFGLTGMTAGVEAVELFTTLPVGNTFSPPHFVSLDENVGGAVTQDVDLDWAFAWSPVVSGVVTDVDVAVSLGDAFDATDENVAQIFLAIDDAGTPGAIIDSYEISSLTSETAGGAVENAVSASNPAVLAGNVYWIVLSAGLPGNGLYTQVGFHQNDQGIGGNYASKSDNGPWVQNGLASLTTAFRISGRPTLVPESATLLLLATGLGLLLVGRARRPDSDRRLIA